MTFYRLNHSEQAAFCSSPEIFPGVQLGYYADGTDQGYCAVVSGLMAVVIDDKLVAEISEFFEKTWRPTPTAPPIAAEIYRRYQIWSEKINFAAGGIRVVDTNRASMYSLLIMAPPPPPSPPGRPTLVPGAPHGRGPLPAWASHLAFQTVTEDREVFYRWEAFPKSLRVDQYKKTVAPWTFASPKSEIPFIETGFSAVARSALPSFFRRYFDGNSSPIGEHQYYAARSFLCIRRREVGLKFVLTSARPTSALSQIR